MPRTSSKDGLTIKAPSSFVKDSMNHCLNALKPPSDDERARESKQTRANTQKNTCRVQYNKGDVMRTRPELHARPHKEKTVNPTHDALCSDVSSFRSDSLASILNSVQNRAILCLFQPPKAIKNKRKPPLTHGSNKKHHPVGSSLRRRRRRLAR